MSIRSTRCADFAGNSPEIWPVGATFQKVGDAERAGNDGRLARLRGTAKAIKESEEHHADARGDKGVEEQAQGEERHGMVEENP